MNSLFKIDMIHFKHQNLGKKYLLHLFVIYLRSFEYLFNLVNLSIAGSQSKGASSSIYCLGASPSPSPNSSFLFLQSRNNLC